MSVNWTPEDDFPELADALEAVTLRDAEGNETSVQEAMRRRVTQREAAASDGRYRRRDVKWNLPQSEVAAAPEVGWTIADSAGGVWTILRVDRDTVSTRWRCWCRELQLAGALSDRVNIQRAAWAKDAHGSPAPTYSDWKIGLSARIQPISAQLGVTQGKRELRATHRLYLLQTYELTESHRVYRPADSQTFRIVGYRKPERIEELFEVTLGEW